MDSTRVCLARSAVAEARVHVLHALDRDGRDEHLEDSVRADLLTLHATVHEVLGDSAVADSAWNAALACRTASFGSTHPRTWETRFLWSRSLIHRESMQRVLDLLASPLKSALQGRPIIHAEEIASVAAYADALYYVGRFTEAGEVYRTSLRAIDEIGDRAVPQVHRSLETYAWYLSDIGLYDEAVQHLRRWIDTCVARGETDLHPYARFQCILGEALFALGRPMEAEAAYLESHRAFMERTNGIGDVTVFANLGVLYLRLRRYDEAERSLRACIALMDPGSSEMGRQLNNLAAVLLATGRVEEAEHACRTALNIQRERLGDANHLVARTRHRLGLILLQRGDHTAADTQLMQACRIGAQVIPRRDHRRVQFMLSWARSSMRVGEVQRADSLVRAAMTEHLEFLVHYWPLLTEKEQIQLRSQLPASRDAFIDHANRHAASSIALTGDLYNLLLADKAIVQENMALIQEQLRRSGDTSRFDVFRRWKEMRMLLANTMRARQDDSTVAALAQHANKLEEELVRSSSTFADAHRPLPATWQQVQAALPPGEAAVEIIRYMRSATSVAESDHIGYAALVLRGGETGPPAFVHIAGSDSLETVWLQDYRTLLVPPRRGEERDYRSTQQRAWRRYWAPIAAQLKGITCVHLAADGVYHIVTPDIMSADGRSIVMDQIELRRTVSTRSLLSPASDARDDRPFVLIGAPNFGSPTPDTVDAAVQHPRAHIWHPLRSARREIVEIDSLLRGSGKNTMTILGDDATEEALEALRSPCVVHIATHGSFEEDTTHAGQPWLREIINNEQYHHAYLRSSLVLAGANTRTSGGGDGYLTAYEASTLDVRRSLVVLSACETGLGYIRSGEGVYGLQRAFLLAGARAVVMSLWKAEDGVSRALMLEFYKQWLQGGDPHAALRTAVASLRSARPWLSPADWGAFVVIE